MPKMKTRKGASKRFKLTKSGKLKRYSAFTNHILTKKTRKQKRRLAKATLVHDADKSRVLRQLGLK